MQEVQSYMGIGRRNIKTEDPKRLKETTVAEINNALHQ